MHQLWQHKLVFLMEFRAVGTDDSWDTVRATGTETQTERLAAANTSAPHILLIIIMSHNAIIRFSIQSFKVAATEKRNTFMNKKRK